MSQTGWEITLGVALCLLNLSGVLLTALLLPGMWVMLLGALAAQWWHNAQFGTDMYSWWTIGVCAALAIAGEVIELVASALGASRFGGTRTGALVSVIGAIVGAIAGSLVLPIIGSIAGAVLGAFFGALLGERWFKRRSWAEAGKSGAGAAIGRLASTVVKVALAVGVAAILSIGAFV